MSKRVEYVSVTLELRITDAAKLRAEFRRRDNQEFPARGRLTLAEMAQMIVDDSERLGLSGAGLCIEQSRSEVSG